MKEREIPKENTSREKPGLNENAEKKIAVNPNPRANENLPEKKEAVKTSGAGSEITDGEGG